MKVFFIDTNLIIQCRDLKVLPWSDVVEDKELLLLISKPVIDEIDRFKHDGNARRAKRAKKATSSLREIVKSESQAIVIQESEPQIKISFSPPLNLEGAGEYNLDLSE